MLWHIQMWPVPWGMIQWSWLLRPTIIAFETGSVTRIRFFDVKHANALGSHHHFINDCKKPHLHPLSTLVFKAARATCYRKGSVLWSQRLGFDWFGVTISYRTLMRKKKLSSNIGPIKLELISCTNVGLQRRNINGCWGSKHSCPFAGASVFVLYLLLPTVTHRDKWRESKNYYTSYPFVNLASVECCSSIQSTTVCDSGCRCKFLVSIGSPNWIQLVV